MQDRRAAPMENKPQQIESWQVLAEILLLIKQSMIHEDKQNQSAQVQSVCNVAALEYFWWDSKGWFCGFPTQADATNAKPSHKLEMTTWFIQVMHFTVRPGRCRSYNIQAQGLKRDAWAAEPYILL